MSSKRQTAAARLHGEALLAAQNPAIVELGRQLRAQHDPDLLSETGGILAGAWSANPLTCINHELIAAGLLLTGNIDRENLAGWIEVGRYRGGGSAIPRHPQN